jgi:hypothetical protein
VSRQERSEEVAVPVEVLTDEELAILTGPGAPGNPASIVVTPYLVELPDADRELVTRTAYRGLLARGILDPPSAEATRAAVARGDGRVELTVRQDVRSVVALREAARVVVAIARTTAVSQDFWYAHVVDDVALLEEVGSDGLHRFALADAVRLPDLAAAAAVHPGCGDAEGDPVAVTGEQGDPTPPDEVLERLGAAVLTADVVVRHVGDTAPPMLGLFTGPEGAWVTSVLEGSGEAPVAVPRRAEEARTMVRDLVEDAFAQVTIHGV